MLASACLSSLHVICPCHHHSHLVSQVQFLLSPSLNSPPASEPGASPHQSALWVLTSLLRPSKGSRGQQSSVWPHCLVGCEGKGCCKSGSFPRHVRFDAILRSVTTGPSLGPARTLLLYSEQEEGRTSPLQSNRQAQRLSGKERRCS